MEMINQTKLRMNKKSFSAGDYILASLIFSGVIALLVLSVGSMAGKYDNSNVVNAEFANKFDKFEDNTKQIERIWNATRNSNEGMTLVGTVELLFSSTFGVIGLIFSSVIEAGSQLSGFGEVFGIPQPVSTVFFMLIFSALTVIIVFRILNSVKGTTQL